MLRAPLTAVVAASLAGCIAFETGVSTAKDEFVKSVVKSRMYPVSENPVPDPYMTYLIVSATSLPENDFVPAYLRLTRNNNAEVLPAWEPMFALRNGRIVFTHAYFANRQGEPAGRYPVNNLPILRLEPGKIYYLGRIEFDVSKRNIGYSVVRDADLFRRACEQAIEIFYSFELVDLGADAPGAEPLPECRVRPQEL